MFGREHDEFAAADGGSYTAGEDLPNGGVGGIRADGSFQGGVAAGEQAADAVADPSGLAGQVIIEPDQHIESGGSR